jgi:hypothetical protein
MGAIGRGSRVIFAAFHEDAAAMAGHQKRPMEHVAMDISAHPGRMPSLGESLQAEGARDCVVDAPAWFAVAEPFVCKLDHSGKLLIVGLLAIPCLAAFDGVPVQAIWRDEDRLKLSAQ